jgi:hypothetical protein
VLLKLDQGFVARAAPGDLRPWPSSERASELLVHHPDFSGQLGTSLFRFGCWGNKRKKSSRVPQ